MYIYIYIYIYISRTSKGKWGEHLCCCLQFPLDQEHSDLTALTVFFKFDVKPDVNSNNP